MSRKYKAQIDCITANTKRWNDINDGNFDKTPPGFVAVNAEEYCSGYMVDVLNDENNELEMIA